jgi:hypothetical protein
LTPIVGILVGSKSEMPVLEKCTARLEELGIEHEIEVRSAHRNPEGVSPLPPVLWAVWTPCSRRSRCPRVCRSRP